MTNLNTAFDVAEKYLDIPKMLDAEGEQAGRKTVKMMMRRTYSTFLPVLKDQNILSQKCSSDV